MIKKSKYSDELKTHRDMYVAQCNKFGGLNLGVGVHYTAGWNAASEILDAVAKLCNAAENEVIYSREQIKQLTAERDKLKSLLEQSYWHVLTEDISLATQISEALKESA